MPTSEAGAGNPFDSDSNLLGDEDPIGTPDLPDFLTIDQAHQWGLEIGKVIPETKIDDAISGYEDVKKKVLDFCKAGGTFDNSGVDHAVTPADWQAVQNTDVQTMVEEIKKVLPLFDNQMMEDMFSTNFLWAL